MHIPRFVMSIMLALVLAGSLWSHHFSASSQAQGVSPDVAAGKVIYELHCQGCHGPGGSGDGPKAGKLRVPPANFHRPMLLMKTDEQLRTSIEFGIVLSPMHAWRQVLTDQQMGDVLAYVRLLGQRGS